MLQQWREHQLQPNAQVVVAGNFPVGVGRGFQNRHHVAVGPHRRKGGRQQVATHRVKGNIYALAARPALQGANEILLAIENRAIAAQPSHKIRLLGRADRGGHLRAPELGQLNRHMAHAPGSGMDQHLLPRRQPRPIAQGLPSRNQHQGSRRRFRKTQAIRLGSQATGIHRRPFRIVTRRAAQPAIAKINRLARLPARHLGADRLDDPRTIAPQHMGRCLGVKRAARSQLGIDRVNAGRFELHQYLARRNLRLGQIL